MAEPPKQRGRAKAKSPVNTSSMLQGTSRSNPPQPPPELAIWGEEDILMDAARLPRKAALAASAAIIARPTSSSKPATPTPARGKTISSSTSSTGLKKCAVNSEEVGRSRKNSKNSSGGGGDGGSRRQSSRGEILDSAVSGVKSKKGGKIVVAGTSAKETGGSYHCWSRNKPDNEDKSKRRKRENGGGSRADIEGSAEDEELNMSSSKKRKGPANAVASSKTTVSPADDKSTKHPSSNDKRSKDGGRQDQESSAPLAKRRGRPPKHGKSSVGSIKETPCLRKRRRPPGSKSCRKDMCQEQPGGRKSSSGKQNPQDESACEGRDEKAKAKNAVQGKVASSSKANSTSLHPERLRSAPNVFKANSSSKPQSQPPGSSPAPRGRPKGKAAVSSGRKGAVKSPALKKTAKPLRPPPPPPPPPYRFEYPGWPAVGGRDLLSVGTFLTAALPILRFRRGFEVKMRQLEEAVTCARPQESSFLAMLHARLLSNRKELKAMRVGEDKFPYSWWTNRLKNRLAQWYLRRAVLRELIEDAERSDEDKEVMADEQEQGFKAKKVEDVGNKRKGGSSRNDVPKTPQCEAPQYDQTHEIVVTGDSVPVNVTRVDTTNGGANPLEQIPPKRQLNDIKDNTSVQAGSENAPAGVSTDAISDNIAEVGGITKPEVSGGLTNGNGGGVEDTGDNHRSRISDDVTRVKKESHSADQMARDEQEPGEKLRCPGELLLEDTDASGDRRTTMDVDTEAIADAETAAGDNCKYENARHREGEVPSTVHPDGAENGRTIGPPTVARTEALPMGGKSATLELDIVGKKTRECSRTIRRAKRPPAQMATQMAEEETQKCKTREREVVAANERQRRRMAQKLAELEADDEDSSDRRKKKSGRKLGPRERLLGEFETMELTDLRLQLRDVETLLRNLEGPSGEGTTVTATANGSIKTPPPTPAAVAVSDGAEASETSHDLGPAGEIDTGTGAARAGSYSKDAGKESAMTKGRPDGCSTSARSPEGNGESSIRSGTIRQGSGLDSVSRSSNWASVAKDADEALTEDVSKGSRVSTPPVAEADSASPHLEIAVGDIGNPTVPSNSTSVSGCNTTEDGGGSRVPNENGICRSEGTGAHVISTVLTSMVSAGTRAPKGGNTCLGGIAVRGECPGAVEDGDLAGDSGVFLMLKEEEIEDDKENPLVKGSYESLTVSQRVAILSALCEFSIGLEHIRERIIDEVEPDILRVTPFGYDSSGRLYYRFSQFQAEMRVYRTVEKESPIPEVDEAAMQTVGRTPSQPPSSSLTTSKRRPQRLRGGDEVELVADSLEGMEKLLDALGKSKSKTKKDDFNLLVTLAEEIEAMRAYVAEQLEKEEKRKASELARERRALLAQAPRRRSGRLISNQRGESRRGETRAHDLEVLPNPPSSPSRSSRGPMGGLDIAASTPTNPDCGEGEHVFRTAGGALVGSHTAAGVSNGRQAACVDAREVQGGGKRARQEEQDETRNKDESRSTGNSEAFSSYPLGKRPRDDEIGTTSDIPPVTMSESPSMKMETDGVHERETGSGRGLAGPDRIAAHVRGNAEEDASVTVDGTTDAHAACEAPINKRQRLGREDTEKYKKLVCHGKHSNVGAPSNRPTEDTRDEDATSFDVLDDQIPASIQPPPGRTSLLPLPKSRDQLECAIDSDRNRATPGVDNDAKASLAEKRPCDSESTQDATENELPGFGEGEDSGAREGTESGESSARTSLNDEALRIMAQAAYSRPKATNRTSGESKSRDAGGSCTEPCGSWNATWKPDINSSLHAGNDGDDGGIGGSNRRC